VRLEGRRRRRCPRCGWTFYDNPVPAVVAVVTGPAGILLARRAAPPHEGTWDLPGGFLELDETPERGLARELSEELGARGTITGLLGFFSERYGPGGFPILAIVYEVRLATRVRAASDVSEARWFQPDAIPWREIAFPSVKRALRRHVHGPGAAARATAGPPRAAAVRSAGAGVPPARSGRARGRSPRSRP
jgi:ADP-ribose pyrophosphatase YjhB (NUDIX family)